MQSKVILLKEKIKLIIPDEILEKIKYLCMNISEVEWSGILVYSVKGTIRRPSSMKITVEDIIPMNKGNKVYTEYKYNEPKHDLSGYDDKMIDYFEEHPEGLEKDWKIGHIHSHNSMNVFFSGTDIDELVENSVSHDFYVSLIVNNYMDFCAKVAFSAETKKELQLTYYSLDEKGKKYFVEKSKVNLSKNKIFSYDCTIISSIQKPLVDEKFKKSVDDIIEKNDINNFPKFSTYQDKEVKQLNFFPTQNVTKSQVIEKNKLDNISLFAIYLLSGSKDEHNDLESCLDYIEDFSDDIDINKFAENILEVYLPYYENYFEDESAENYIDRTKKVIELFEEYEDCYLFLSPTIMLLKKMLVNFKKLENGK